MTRLSRVPPAPFNTALQIVEDLPVCASISPLPTTLPSLSEAVCPAMKSSLPPYSRYPGYSAAADHSSFSVGLSLRGMVLPPGLNGWSIGVTGVLVSLFDPILRHSSLLLLVG